MAELSNSRSSKRSLSLSPSRGLQLAHPAEQRFSLVTSLTSCRLTVLVLDGNRSLKQRRQARFTLFHDSSRVVIGASRVRGRTYALAYLRDRDKDTRWRSKCERRSLSCASPSCIALAATPCTNVCQHMMGDVI